jgi:hypothetical protein
MIRLKYQETKEEVSASPHMQRMLRVTDRRSWKLIILIRGFRSYYEGAHRQKTDRNLNGLLRYDTAQNYRILYRELSVFLI